MPYKLLLLEVFILFDLQFPLLDLSQCLQYGLRSVGNLPEADAIGHFQPDGLIH